MYLHITLKGVLCCTWRLIFVIAGSGVEPVDAVCDIRQLVGTGMAVAAAMLRWSSSQFEFHIGLAGEMSC